MAQKLLTSCGIALLVALAAGAPAAAGPVKLTIEDGRVSLAAQDATLGQILAEWERIGHTRIINRDLLPSAPMTLSLTSVPEADALAILLRTLGGYVAVRRAAAVSSPSLFTRLVIISGTAAVRTMASSQSSSPPPAPAAPQPSAGGLPQRRVLADGRIVNLIENPDRPGELTIVDDDGSAGPGRFGQQEPVNPDPLVGPGGRGLQMQPGQMPSQPGVYRGGQTSADPFNLQPPAGRPGSAPASAPTAPGTAVGPGVLVPGQKAPTSPTGRGGQGG